MTPASPGTYGAPKQNPPQRLNANPSTNIDATNWNPAAESLAQLTQTAPRMRVIFPTVTSGNPSPILVQGEWLTTVLNAPSLTVTRVTAGTYLVQPLPSATPPGTWQNSLNQIELLSFSWSRAVVDGSVFFSGAGFARTSRNATSVTVYCYDTSIVSSTLTYTLSDYGGQTPILIEAG